MLEPLAVFRDPGSVAVVGASADPAKWGYWLAKGALSGAHRRQVYLINHQAKTILDTVCLPALSALDSVPQLVAIAVPGEFVMGVVEEALALGTRGFLAINAAVPNQEQLAKRVREAGARLIGPNSLGLFDGATRLQLTWGDFIAGPLAIVSQSGQIGTEIAAHAARAGLGVSRFVSVGNQIDVTAVELLRDLITHEQTRCVALYLESFTEDLHQVLLELRRAGKPVLLLTIGSSVAGRRAAVSHTGSITSPMDAVDALCAAAGALRLDSPSRLAEVAAVVCAGEQIRGRRVAVVGDSGGQGALAADMLGAFELPELSSRLQKKLAAGLPASAAVGNPIDLAGGGEQDLRHYARLPALLARSGEVDAVVLTGYFGQYCLDTPGLAEREVAVAGELAAAVDLPLLVHSMADAGPTIAALRAAGVPVFGTIDAVTRGLAGAAALQSNQGRTLPPLSRPPGHEVLGGAESGGEVLGGAESGGAESGGAESGGGVLGGEVLGGAESGGAGSGRAGSGRAGSGRAGSGRAVQEVAALPVDSAAGWVGFMAAGRIVRSEAELPAALAELSGPYVLKANWLAHKTEHDGVRLGLPDGAAVLTAYREMKERLGDGEFLVQEIDQRDDVVELLIGARRVPGIGPVVVLGRGGVQAELHKDAVMELAPVSTVDARRMIERLRCVELLHGWRGQPAVDLEAIAQAVVEVSQLIAGRTDLGELEFNPVRVGPDGLIAVDSLAVFACA